MQIDKFFIKKKFIKCLTFKIIPYRKSTRLSHNSYKQCKKDNNMERQSQKAINDSPLSIFP